MVKHYNARLFSCGLWKVTDLYTGGRLVNFDTWKQRGAEIKDFLLFQGILAAVPKSWTIMLKNMTKAEVPVETCIMRQEKFIPVSALSQKDLNVCYTEKDYKRLKRCELRAIIRHNSLYNDISPKDWEQIFMLPHKTSYENYVTDIQYKILSRIVATNDILYKMGNVASPTCTFCHMQREDLDHLFYDCLITRDLWHKIYVKWNKFKGVQITHSKQNCILGYYEGFDISDIEVLNVILMYAKTFIYQCKLKDTSPSHQRWEIYLNHHVDILSHVPANAQKLIKLKEYLQA